MPHTRPGSLDGMEGLLLYRMGRVSLTAGRLVVRMCEGRYGITRREWHFLGQLALQDRLAPSELAQRSHLDKARTSRAITSLVNKGLVQRHVKASDRRQAEVALTEAGRSLYESLMPQVRSLNQELLGALSDAEASLLYGMLDRLQRRSELMVDEHRAEWPKAMRHKGRTRRSGI
ncbi:MarR family transcriptional regulator [Hydrogenophaga sp. YM1]|uniref:MarR family winged helix-turn-helix transcriptional regulator n=1 Tax=Hydrogenophaga sp. YM1 TaxID=2806262 RepID=UPI00195A37C7|nr:MarR family transcriptional regulator [Hydrogenophaga sp. YM1]QRR34003.1 MarR family transcriptional regulator [Hydrogenophaga sp. YM1]